MSRVLGYYETMPLNTGSSPAWDHRHTRTCPPADTSKATWAKTQQIRDHVILPGRIKRGRVVLLFNVQGNA